MSRTVQVQIVQSYRVALDLAPMVKQCAPCRRVPHELCFPLKSMRVSPRIRSRMSAHDDADFLSFLMSVCSFRLYKAEVIKEIMEEVQSTGYVFQVRTPNGELQDTGAQYVAY